jgi:hypothetical protein
MISIDIENLNHAQIYTRLFHPQNQLLLGIGETYGGDGDVSLDKSQIDILISILQKAVSLAENNKENWVKLGHILSNNGDGEQIHLFVYLHKKYVVIGLSETSYLSQKTHCGIKIFLPKNKAVKYIDILEDVKSNYA